MNVSLIRAHQKLNKMKSVKYLNFFVRISGFAAISTRKMSDSTELTFFGMIIE